MHASGENGRGAHSFEDAQGHKAGHYFETDRGREMRVSDEREINLNVSHSNYGNGDSVFCW